MIDFNPFAGGPLRKAPKNLPGTPGIVHRLLKASDPVVFRSTSPDAFKAHKNIGIQIAEYLERHPDVSRFYATDLECLAPWILNPDLALRQSAEAGRLLADNSTTPPGYTANKRAPTVGYTLRQFLRHIQDQPDGYLLTMDVAATLAGKRSAATQAIRAALKSGALTEVYAGETRAFRANVRV